MEKLLRGTGTAIALTADTGYFWFFSASNVELVVKVLDACTFDDRFWVYAAGLTDVEVTLTVTDVRNGTVRTYHQGGGCTAAPGSGAGATVG